MRDRSRDRNPQRGRIRPRRHERRWTPVYKPAEVPDIASNEPAQHRLGGLIEHPMKHTPTAVVFDVGNVLLRWDPRNLYRKVFEDEERMEWFLATFVRASGT